MCSFAGKVSLISKIESEESGVSKDEAEKFLQVAEVKVTENDETDEDEDADDLVRQL